MEEDGAKGALWGPRCFLACRHAVPSYALRWIGLSPTASFRGPVNLEQRLCHACVVCVRRSGETSAQSFEAWGRRGLKASKPKTKAGAAVADGQRVHHYTLSGAGRRAVLQHTFDLCAAKISLRHC